MGILQAGVFIGSLGTGACRGILCGQVDLVGLENRMGPVEREGVFGVRIQAMSGIWKNVNGV